MSDIKGICDVAHEKNIPVFVDSAHGAHLKFMGMENPVEQGADAVSISLHKTLPAMTQTALLLVNGGRVSPSSVKEKINVFQTSSPSYVLMASVSECLEFVKNEDNEFKRYKNALENFYSKAKFERFELIKNDDLGKVVISTAKTDISGLALMEKLRAGYGIELEMAYDNYALAMTSVCDEEKELNRLLDALYEIDRQTERGAEKKIKYPSPKKGKAVNGETEAVLLCEAKDRVCASYIWAYPPGVPIIAPGEIIDEEIIEYITSLDGTDILGMKDGQIKVFK
jgi:arginine/lysine/ornithine decarboxylase